MDSIIDKGERLLSAMFSGGMRRIRLATSNGELWGYAGAIGERADRGLTPSGWHVYALMGRLDGDGAATLMADCVVDHLLDVALPIDLGDRPLMDVGEWEYAS